MSQIRVLHLISSFAVEGPLGGVARYVLNLSRTFDREHIAPSVAGLWDYHSGHERDHCRTLNQEGISAFIAADWDENSPYQSCVRAVQGLYAADFPPVDIIHSHGEFSDLAALLWRQRLGAKALVRTVHNEIEWSKRPQYGRFFPNLLYPPAFDLELGISQQVTANLNRRPLARLLGKKAQLLSNAVDFERFAPDPAARQRIRREFGLSDNTILLGTIGRMTRQKGFDVLLQAMPAVLQKYPQAMLLIVGEGPLRQELQELTASLGIGSHVHFTGARKDIEAVLAGFDLFISSSRWEGLPTVLLESIAAKLPLVATAVSGSIELVQEGVNGRLIPVENPVALAEAVQAVLQDLPHYQQGSQEIRHQIEQQFSLQAITRQLEELYARLILPG